jgi:hypothetical protein
MIRRSSFRLLLAVAAVLSGHQVLLAQSMERLTVEPWNDGDLQTSWDHPIFENTAHVKDTNYDTQLDFWDSYGRVRLDRHDADGPFVAYRIFTGNVGTSAPGIQGTMDEFALAGGFHLGQAGGWKIDTLLGAGYSGTHPFLNEKGIFGIGDIAATRALTDKTSLLLSVDYAGNNALLPDVPLPGFAVIHREEGLNYELGFPVNSLDWKPFESVTISVKYTVPYTGSLDIEYLPWRHVGFYGQASNFYNGFTITRQSLTDRQFLQSSTVEAGIRFIFDPYVDAAIGIGYAFNQSLSDGYDVRDLRPVAQISDATYIAVIVRGRI